MASRQLTAECSLEKLPGGPDFLTAQSRGRLGNAKKTDGFVVQHSRLCSLIQNQLRNGCFQYWKTNSVAVHYAVVQQLGEADSGTQRQLYTGFVTTPTGGEHQSFPCLEQ